MHGGLAPIKHGRYSKVTRPEVQELLEHLRADSDPLDLTEDALMQRALVIEFLNRYDQMVEGIHRWHASFQEDYLAARGRWLEHVQGKTEPILEDLSRFIADFAEQLSDIGDMPRELQAVLDHASERLLELERKNRHAPESFDPAPDPLEFVKKPRQLLDLSDAIDGLERVGKTVERIEKIKLTRAITLEVLARLVDAMGAEVGAVLKKHLDDDSAKRIGEEIAQHWDSIRVDPGSGAVLKA